MIIARIDNELTPRTPYRRGRSFNGALRYLLTGSRDTPRPDRVLHAETVNIWADVGEAAHEMATTWENRFRLMQAAGGLPRNGSDNKAPVYHLVMSWSPDEDPPRASEMADLAKQLLHLLGLTEHEAVLVVHGDTANPHIHIIVNTVHPITGRTAPLRYDKRIMQGFAARYEELRDKVVCRARFAPDVRGAFNAAAGRRFTGRRISRPSWARTSEPVREAKRAALPSVLLDALTHHHATFTPSALAQAVTASTASAREFSETMAAVMTSPELVRLHDDGGTTRYTTRAQQQAEARLAASAAKLAGSLAHDVTTAARTIAFAQFTGDGQAGTREALGHLLEGRGLSAVVGYAGAGKSTLLKTAADAWRSSGYRPLGLAIAGRAAEGIEADAGIPSGTIAGFLIGLDNGSMKLGAKDILVIDEAGMVASRQLDRLLLAARDAGAKVVLVGDPEQLQAIEAGGPFRYLIEHYDHARLSTVWRQQASWMRNATRDLAEGRTGHALAQYEAAGMVEAHATTEEATARILDMWLANRERGLSQLILAATNADAQLINAAARARLHASGALGRDVVLAMDDGPTPVATGDRIIFRRNDKTLKVKNGTTATVMSIAGTRLTVVVDGKQPRTLSLDVATYPHLTHGYAVTIHKSQGATVDRTYVLAAPNMDRHSAYVALSRHRERVSLHWSADAFPSRASLGHRLSRKRLKDLTLDYKEAVAASLRDLASRTKPDSDNEASIAAWARLYERQRAETTAVQGMSALRRTFWYAANLRRLLEQGAVTLEKLHARERAQLASLQIEQRRRASTVSPISVSTKRTEPVRVSSSATKPQSGRLSSVRPVNNPD